MNVDTIKSILNQSFHHLDEIAPDILCATDIYQDKPYAVRYFDLSDNIASHSDGLTKYLDSLLGDDYFDVKRPIDLRSLSEIRDSTSGGEQVIPFSVEVSLFY